MSEHEAGPTCIDGESPQHHYSFVVRCWVITEDKLRCRVVDTSTGLVYPLTSSDDLPDLLSRLAHASGGGEAAP